MTSGGDVASGNAIKDERSAEKEEKGAAIR